MSNLIKKHLGEGILENIKASEIRDLKKEEKYLRVNSTAALVMSFPLLISLTSLILWNNKFTILLLVTFLLIFGFCVLATLSSSNSFNKEIKKIKAKYQ